MPVNHKFIVAGFLMTAILMMALPMTVLAGPYNSLDGVTSVNTVFDIRVKSPKALAIHLDLIYDSYNDPNIQAIQNKPEFVVILMGPAVKFLSADRDGYAPEDIEHLDFIQSVIPEMTARGIRLEVCMFAAAQQGMDENSIPAGITPVPNGWISSIGYQHQGYALIPDF